VTPGIHVGILGATGYGAGELLRLFTQHPHVRVASLVSSSAVGEAVAKVHPHLRGFYDLRLSESLDWDALLRGRQAVVFAALPHGASSKAVAAVLSEVGKRGAPADRVCIIDMSGDLRLKDPKIHAAHYPEVAPVPELREQFEYGLPELLRERIQNTRWVSNPGCLASAAILAGLPLVATSALEGSVVVDAKTGSSGSGRQLKDTTHHPTRHADFRAYKPLAHQHEPEILQIWGDPRGERIQLSFVPQSMDTARGVFVTLHATLPRETTTAALAELYRHFYRESPFVRIVEDSPTLQDVVGSNFCDLAVAVRGRQVIAMAALDNLVKGMSGAAIQNMNLMCGLPETTGLWFPAVRPV
jgi:N-acetyl-gamma-glutamyl-phosphate reductase